MAVIFFADDANAAKAHILSIHRSCDFQFLFLLTVVLCFQLLFVHS